METQTQTLSMKNMKTPIVNRNMRYLARVLGGVEKFHDTFKKSKVSTSSVYAYVKEEEPSQPNMRLLTLVSEYFGLTLEELHEKDLARSGWKYVPKKLPKPQGEFIGGVDDYSYRTFQVIEILQMQYGLKSLSEFVKTLDAYKASYTTFTNAQLGRQKVTADMLSDLKACYPEVNMNFIMAGELPAVTDDTDKLKREIMKMVEERLKR